MAENKTTEKREKQTFGGDMFLWWLAGGMGLFIIVEQISAGGSLLNINFVGFFLVFEALLVLVALGFSR